MWSRVTTSNLEKNAVTQFELTRDFWFFFLLEADIKWYLTVLDFNDSPSTDWYFLLLFFISLHVLLYSFILRITNSSSCTFLFLFFYISSFSFFFCGWDHLCSHVFKKTNETKCGVDQYEKKMMSSICSLLV